MATEKTLKQCCPYCGNVYFRADVGIGDKSHLSKLALSMTCEICNKTTETFYNKNDFGTDILPAVEATPELVAKIKESIKAAGGQVR